MGISDDRRVSGCLLGRFAPVFTRVRWRKDGREGKGGHARRKGKGKGKGKGKERISLSPVW